MSHFKEHLILSQKALVLQQVNLLRELVTSVAIYALPHAWPKGQSIGFFRKSRMPGRMASPLDISYYRP